MLTVAEVGSYGLPDNVVRDKSEITGLVAGDTIYAGEYLWRDRFMTEEAYKEAASKNSLGLSDGTYLLTIALPSESSGLAGILRAGDIVDVYISALRNLKTNGQSFRTTMKRSSAAQTSTRFRKCLPWILVTE